ncbi:MAG: hypothetical protein HZA08_14310 [Nitrospirae bacterium]|nr:hypothetical protein [Nitrospirota bacterium]
MKIGLHKDGYCVSGFHPETESGQDVFRERFPKYKKKQVFICLLLT